MSLWMQALSYRGNLANYVSGHRILAVSATRQPHDLSSSECMILSSIARFGGGGVSPIGTEGSRAVVPRRQWLPWFRMRSNSLPAQSTDWCKMIAEIQTELRSQA
jgi:hypothetical protein